MDQKAQNIKVIEIGVLCGLLPNIIKDVLHIQPSIALPLGIFTAAVIAYWVPPNMRPPEGRFGLIAWLGIALAVSLGYWLIRSVVVLLWNA